MPRVGRARSASVRSKRGLPGAVRADHGEHLARRHRQRRHVQAPAGHRTGPRGRWPRGRARAHAGELRRRPAARRASRGTRRCTRAPRTWSAPRCIETSPRRSRSRLSLTRCGTSIHCQHGPAECWPPCADDKVETRRPLLHRGQDQFTKEGQPRAGSHERAIATIEVPLPRLQHGGRGQHPRLPPDVAADHQRGTDLRDDGAEAGHQGGQEREPRLPDEAPRGAGRARPRAPASEGETDPGSAGPPPASGR